MSRRRRWRIRFLSFFADPTRKWVCVLAVCWAATAKRSEQGTDNSQSKGLTLRTSLLTGILLQPQPTGRNESHQVLVQFMPTNRAHPDEELPGDRRRHYFSASRPSLANSRVNVLACTPNNFAARPL